ncbi:hypothetical protein L1049_019781 [Liquidambar formosana]|uniref:Increased DNA methylation 3 n=1 Tax=Liquidambar formosana TaxID=63359 RepID=A0AAP0S6S8_LIQFO
MYFQENNHLPGPVVEVSLNDQHFLLNFIMSTYLGPDVMSDNPRRSASQRLAEGLPPYTAYDLGPSFVSIFQLESLYYYVLRNAHPSLVLNRNLLHMYLKGNLLLPNSGLPEDSEQFTSFFPSNLHEQTSYPESFKIVKGIVLIDDPVTSYMKQEDMERFRCLSGIDNFKIDIDESLHQHGDWTGKEETQQQHMKNYAEIMAGNISNENCYLPVKLQDDSKKRRRSEPWQIQVPTCSNGEHLSKKLSNGEHLSKKLTFSSTCNWDGPSMMSLFTVPNVEECISKASICLTGTARKGRAGPPVGVVDIGVSEVAYFFRVALPGVRKDRCQFSCEVECDGKVLIRGLTASGGQTIMKQSRAYHMKFQQLSPPGPFTLSFSLPGPVDPRLFSPIFRNDGIFEAVVVRFGVISGL